VFLLAAILLSIERIAYIWAWRYPESFREFCERAPGGLLDEPITALRRLFYVFKAIQISVFLARCYHFGNGSLVFGRESALPVAAGAILLVVGQTLNLGVFYRLGTVGVFYGNRFGRDLPWCDEFPFSMLNHPQYTGALISIWGFFIATCFPRPDWFLLPLLETLYYCVGALLEQ
jgi:methylene-fatty-acyl-phospholipid synthase